MGCPVRWRCHHSTTPPFLGVFRKPLDGALSAMGYLTRWCSVKGWTQWFQRYVLNDSVILKTASLSLLPSRNSMCPIKSQDVILISQSCAWDVADWLTFWAPDGNCKEEGRQSLCCKNKDMLHTLPSHSFAPWLTSSHSPRSSSLWEKRQCWDPPQSLDILKMLVRVERPRDAWIWHIPWSSTAKNASKFFVLAIKAVNSHEGTTCGNMA